MAGGIYESVLFELNSCRSNPSKYSSKLSNTLKYYKGKIFEKPGYPAFETEEGPENVQACIKYLKSVRPAAPLEWSEGLAKAAQAHVDDLGPKGLSGHDSSDGSDAAVRVERFGQWSGQLGENIDYGNCEGEDIVVSLLIDDGVLARGQRLNIMKREHVYVGIGFGYHSEFEYMCVIIFAEVFSESLPESLTQSQPVEEKPKAYGGKGKPEVKVTKNEKSNRSDKSSSKSAQKSAYETFDVSEYDIEGISHEEIKDIKQFFDQLDYNQSGAIEASEIMAALDSEDIDATASSVLQMLTDFKVEGSRIDFDELLEIISSNKNQKSSPSSSKPDNSKPSKSSAAPRPNPPEEKKLSHPNLGVNDVNQIKEIFDAYDSEQLGWINLEDLVSQITENEYEPGVLEIVDIMITIDTKGKRRVTFDKLLALLDARKEEIKNPKPEKKSSPTQPQKKTVTTYQKSEVKTTTYTYKGQTYTKTTKKTVTNLPARGDFDPEDYARAGLTEEEIIEIKDAFDLFDVEKTGKIETKDLRQAMENQGFQYKSPTIFKMVCELDVEGRNRVDFDEFLDMMTENVVDESSKEEVRKVFNLFDVDQTGYIELKNLRQIARELGENLKEEDIIELITKSDADGDGKVSFQEFYDIMSRTTY
jgi:Ca2+-binding EF-hand superfamily protein/uncharacterized protein YkwD